MSKPNHRVAAGTKRARQITSAKGSMWSRAKAIIGIDTMSAADKERAEWNARVEARKAAKKGR